MPPVMYAAPGLWTDPETSCAVKHVVLYSLREVVDALSITSYSYLYLVGIRACFCSTLWLYLVYRLPGWHYRMYKNQFHFGNVFQA